MKKVENSWLEGGLLWPVPQFPICLSFHEAVFPWISLWAEETPARAKEALHEKQNSRHVTIFADVPLLLCRARGSEEPPVLDHVNIGKTKAMRLLLFLLCVCVWGGVVLFSWSSACLGIPFIPAFLLPAMVHTQERTGVKMIMIQDGPLPTGADKPLRITGDAFKVQVCIERGFCRRADKSWRRI